MPRNTNPWVSELLTWHGHDRGGVRVPFQAGMGKPLGTVVDTPLIQRLRKLARALVDGTAGIPRWIFLVGGPGNGKSEAVEAFIQELDTLANAPGQLTSTVAERFVPNPVTRRRVDVPGAELKEPVLRKRVRRLIIIQDASAVDGPAQNAEDPLIDDLADLLAGPAGQEPVFVCCANRGLLARARSAIQSKERLQWLNTPEITELLTQLLTATGLGPSALAANRPRCWPLECDARFAAWPLDLDTIILQDHGSSAFEQILSAAIDERKWQGSGNCDDCTSRQLCPFYANAAMLRDDKSRRNLLVLLRHGEVATGQRWNFRDAFSLCAELLIGQRDDFKTGDAPLSPCAWVHQRADEIALGNRPSTKLEATWELALHMYSLALFPEWPDPSEELDGGVVQQSTLTQAVIKVFQQRQRPEGTQVRHLLAGHFSQKLDPAKATPATAGSLLRMVEDEFGQSARQGLENFGSRLPPLLTSLLELMALAESDWSETVRESSKVHAILETLRILSSTLVKRFLGVQQGEYLNLEYLLDYEALLKDPRTIRTVVAPLRSALAPGGIFGGSLVRVFGQPAPEASKDILVTYRLGNVIPHVASESTDDRPGHDIPWVEVETERVPLTFDLFVALRSSSAGAELASFPPHTRAALDKVRNAIAGRLSRDKEGMLGGGVLIKIGQLGHLAPAANGALEFQGNVEGS